MPVIKIGSKSYNGESIPVYLLQGAATRDGEPGNGRGPARVSVAAQESKDGTMYVTVNGWRNKAQFIASVRKADSILAIGSLKKREWNDKTYWEMDADFIVRSGAGLSEAQPPEFEDLPGEDAQLPWEDLELPI